VRLDDDQLRALADMIAASLQPPRWLTLELSSKYLSFGRSHLEVLIKEKLIISKNVRLPGASRGRRLIDRLSLDAFIEGSGDEPAALGMNRQ
jgi:hypothetical protein